MKIILLRHGKPQLQTPERIKANELHQWVNTYNSAGIDHIPAPPAELTQLAQQCNTVVCSDLPRSIESARLLGIENIDYTDSLFREMQLPYGNWRTPNASPMFWAVLFRTLWFLGYAKNGEHIKQAKHRAKQATHKLEELATASDSILFVGHGFMNRFIARSLLANGWAGPSQPGRHYWDYAIYEYNRIA